MNGPVALRLSAGNDVINGIAGFAHQKLDWIILW